VVWRPASRVDSHPTALRQADQSDLDHDRLDLAVVGLLMGGFGSTALQIPVPLWLIEPRTSVTLFA